MKIGTSVLGSKVGRRMLGLFAVVALIPLAFLSYFMVVKVSGTLEAIARERLSEQSKSRGLALMERLQLLEIDLRTVREQLIEGPEDSLRESQRLRQRLGGRFKAIVHQVDDNIRSLFLGRDWQPPDLSTRERSHLETGAVLIRSGLGVEGTEILMVIELPPPGRGELFAWIAQDYLWGEEDLLESGPAVYVFDDERLLHSVAPIASLEAPLREALRHEPLSGSLDWAREDGADDLAGYWRLNLRPRYLTSWVIASSLPRGEVLLPAEELLSTFLNLALLTFLVVVLLSARQINKILQPISLLRMATRRFGADELDVRVQIDTKDEFAELGGSFNRMAKRLGYSIRQQELIRADLTVARDDAIAAMQSESEFLTNISHELRTPTTIIGSCAEILQDLADPTEMAEYLQILREESGCLAHLVETMLKLTEYHQGKTEWEITMLDIPRSVSEVVQKANESHGSGGSIVEMTVENVVPQLAGDKARLEQVWSNLIDNAIKFGRAGEAVHVRVIGRQSSVVVEVRDCGEGIAHGDQELIFEPFRQVGRDILTEKAKGMGLGLTIARNIVHRHLGEIEVESEPGVGSTFSVFLPIMSVTDLQVAPGRPSTELSEASGEVLRIH